MGPARSGRPDDKLVRGESGIHNRGLRNYFGNARVMASGCVLRAPE